MQLADAIKAVAKKPTSIRHRATLAKTLEAAGVADASKVWQATVELAAARGEFFPALLLARRHLSDNAQIHALRMLSARYGHRRPRETTSQPLPDPPAGVPNIPEEAEAQQELALRLGTEIQDLGLPMSARLPRIPLFENLDEIPFVGLAMAFEEHPFRRGDVLIQQGVEEQVVYLVAFGELKVTQDRAGEVHDLAFVSAPALMGELSLLTAVPRRANVTGQSDGMALRINGAVMKKLGETQPALTTELLRLVRRRLIDNVLSSSPVFSELDDEQRVKVLEAFQVRTTGKGQVLSPPGEEPDGLYIILHGAASIWSTEGDAQQEQSQLNEGDLFGPSSLTPGSFAEHGISMPQGGAVLSVPLDNYLALKQAMPKLTLEKQRIDVDAVPRPATVSTRAFVEQQLPPTWLLKK